MVTRDEGEDEDEVLAVGRDCTAHYTALTLCTVSVKLVVKTAN